jgi:hypothetical protein
MAERTTLRTGGFYRVVRRVGYGPGARRSHIYQIEDVAGQTICHCGCSRAEAELLFEMLEHPRRRLVTPA